MEDSKTKQADLPLEESKPVPDSSLRTALEQEWQPSEVPSDTQCLGFGTVFLLFLSVFTGWSYNRGDPDRLLRGWDEYGKFCEWDEDRKGMTYTVFVAPESDIRLTQCSVGCPAVTATEAICLYDTSLRLISDLGCYDAVPSVPFHNRYCLPSTHTSRLEVLSWLMQPGQVMTRVTGDIVRAWDLLSVGVIISLVAGFILLILLHGGVYVNAGMFVVSGSGGIALIGAMAYAVFEEAHRVDGMICGGYSVVNMHECNEGETSSGYRSLAWFIVSMGGCALVAFYLMLGGFPKGVKLLTILVRLISPWLLLCPILCSFLSLGVYAYLLTLTVFAVSTGDTSSHSGNDIPLSHITPWEFSTPERVLMFFLVGMGFWCLATVGHLVEFVAARCVALRYLHSDSDNGLKSLCQATGHVLKYRLGSVLMAAMILPPFRLPRSLILGMKRARKSRVLGPIFRPVMKQWSCFRSCYNRWLKYMTSDGLAWEAIKGGSFINAAVMGHVLLKRHKRMQTMAHLNTANYLVWAYQLLLTMLGPVFMAYYITYEKSTLDNVSMREITSITSLSLYMLIGSWGQSQVIGCFIRGVLHGGFMAFLMDIDMNPAPERPTARLLLAFLKEPMSPQSEGEDEADGKTSKRHMNRIRPFELEKPFPVVEAEHEAEESGQEVRSIHPPPPSRPTEIIRDIST